MTATLADDSAIRGFQPGRGVHRSTACTEPGTTPRLGEWYTFRPYVYRGTGADTLTAWMDDEPVQRLSPRQERIEMIADLRQHDNSDIKPPPGAITAREAAEKLGVSVRTVHRYRAALRAARRTP